MKPRFASEMEKVRISRPVFWRGDGNGGSVEVAEMGNEGDLRIYNSEGKAVMLPCADVLRFAEWLQREWGA